MNTSESLFPDPTYFTHLKDLREAYSHRLNSRVIERMFKDPNEQTYEFELGIGGVYNFQIFIKAVEKNKRIHGIQNTRRIELSVQASRTVSE